MKINVRSLLAALTFLCIVPSYGHTHDIYTEWKVPDVRIDGKRISSCCNNIDCAPRPSKYVDDHWEVLFNDKWLKVPDKKVEQSYNDEWNPGDNRSHACINPNGVIYCFRAGEWLQ